MPILWILASNAAAGLALVLVSRPMILRRVKRNHFYGFRTRKTLSSDAIWYPANEYSGRTLAVAGTCITGAALVLWPIALFHPLGTALYAMVCAGVVMLSLGWSVLSSLHYLKRL